MLLLPLYLDHLGASRTEIGTIMPMATLGSVFLRPGVAWSLDVLGRKTTLVLLTVLLAAAMGSFGLVRELGPLVYVIRAFVGMGVGGLWTAYFTVASDIVPEDRRTEGI